MKIGMVGLGRMGMNMTRRIIEGGDGGDGSGTVESHEVVAYNRTAEKVGEAVEFGAEGAITFEELIEKLDSPDAPDTTKVIWLMVPAGKATEDVIDKLKGLLIKGDIIIDGGNTFYKDDIRRYAELKELGIGYVDAGTSGGIWGRTEGYCLMLGGDKDHFDTIEPIVKTLAPRDGYMHCGESGSGHFVKMVHNGIEYALMESYAEGFELLNASRYGEGIDEAALATLWNKGSVIRSWLLELIANAFKDDISGIRGYVEDSGEGRWTVKEGVDLGVQLPAISAALDRRFRSRIEDSHGEKLLAAMRAQFGGHAVKKSLKK
jgi:6-phosphogluconate dehydrogenase